jgi:succinate dehydrogenase/fumarate reductase flavoprotein subunit
MNKKMIEIDGIRFPLYSLNTLIIGSGAAALNAAVSLSDCGQKNIAIATDNWGGGTSNNAGSDKQTYYKLSLSGDVPDSPLEMARDLFNGGCMHGDIALCEAQNSAQAFFHLMNLGVPFPHDRFGAYVGYKTDHDPRGRATSAGPLTSRMMFECLARDVKKKEIEVFDRHEVIALLTEKRGGKKRVIGALAIDKNNLDSKSFGFVVFNAVNVVLATGGPAGMYKSSVYPESQLGSSGLAFEIGAVGNNLTESQYGLASIQFRWNLSGTYQQVIPRYVSTDADGRDEQEFLNRYFPDMGQLATAIFLKGYQWPFDPRKVRDYGSSLIDILVYQETVMKGRRVFLDFTRNPSGGGALEDFSFDLLDKEASDYLEKSGALFGTPIERLRKMNQPAVDLYKSNGIDLSQDYLEIAVCAQHNNGGIQGSIWWESNIKHLFPVGEVNGTHGVYRPGGSALNAGQVGSLRAALFISKRYTEAPPEIERFLASAEETVRSKYRLARQMVDSHADKSASLQKAREEIQERMSACGAPIRTAEKVKEAIRDAWGLYSRLKKETKVSSAKELTVAFKNLDLCLTHALYLEAIGEYLEKGGKSRGSYLVMDPEGDKPCEELGDEWKFSLNEEDAFVNQKILQIYLDEGAKVKKQWVDIRPIPQEETWFENVWNEFRQDKIIK